MDSNSSYAEAKNILKELRARNFSKVTATSNREKLSSINATIIANRLMKQAMDLDEKAQKFNSTFKDFLEAYRSLKTESRMTNAHADNATNLLKMAMSIDYKVITFHLKLLLLENI